MSNAQRDIRRKQQALAYAERIGNVRKTCLDRLPPARATAETLSTIAADPRHIGGESIR